MPRVLLVGNFLAGGSWQVCQSLAERLSDAGWQVHTTSSVRPRVMRLADMMHSAWRLRNSVDMAMVEVYSGPAFRWAEVVSALLAGQRTPFVLALHGGNLPSFAAHHPRRVIRTLNRAAAVVAPSDYLKESMAAYRADIQLLPNAIELRHYPFRLRAPARPKLVWLRSFHDIYDPTMAVRVLAALKKRHSEATLRMVGPDKGDGSLQRAAEAARELGVLDDVEFVGAAPKERVPEELAKADIFINTSRIDNMPVSVIEALGCGLCVVSTNAGGVARLLTDGQDALLTPPGDAERMAAACSSVIADDELASRLSQAGRSTAERFAWSSVLPEWEELFASVVAGRGEPSGEPAAVA